MTSLILKNLLNYIVNQIQVLIIVISLEFKNYQKPIQYNYLFQFFSDNNQQPMESIIPGPFLITNSFASKQENTTKGHQWAKQDLIKYAVYLNFSVSMKVYESEIEFNSWDFFRKLSIFIQSKNPNQCRIFHKKMMSDHSSISSLITELKSSIHKFQEWEKNYESSLINLINCLKREREQTQKQLTNKITQNKLNKDFSPKEFQQDQDYISLVKDQKQLGPTGVDYQEDKEIKPQSVQLVKSRGRPSFSFCMEEEQNISNELSIFSASMKPNFFSIPKRMSLQKQGLEQRVKDCQKSFVNYLSKLSSLSDAWNSFSDY